MKKSTLLFLFSIISFSLSAQLVFNEIPSEKQLFGRDVETNYGQININGYVNVGLIFDLEFSNWNIGEPNNDPNPENAAEIVNNIGKWNDRNANDTQGSYVEFEGSVTMVIEECGPGRSTVKGMQPSKGEPTVVLKTLTCAEVDELIALHQALQQFAGAS